LSTEDGGIQNDIGDVVQDVFLDLDEVGLSKDDDLDWLDRLAREIFEILDFRPPSENSGEQERAWAGPSGWVEPERALASWIKTRPAPRGGDQVDQAIWSSQSTRF